MTGYNSMTLCPAAMKQAMQSYLNGYVLATGHRVKVECVEMTKTGEFVVKFTEAK